MSKKNLNSIFFSRSNDFCPFCVEFDKKKKKNYENFNSARQPTRKFLASGHDARAFKNESNKIGTPIACHVSCLAENRTFKRIS